MEKDNFWIILALLKAHLKEKDTRATNGAIEHSFMLSAALKSFACRYTFDIMFSHQAFFGSCI